MMGFEPYIWSNVMTALLLWGAVFVVRVVRGQRLWREAAETLWQRRRFALVASRVHDISTSASMPPPLARATRQSSTLPSGSRSAVSSPEVQPCGRLPKRR